MLPRTQLSYVMCYISLYIMLPPTIINAFSPTCSLTSHSFEHYLAITDISLRLQSSVLFDVSKILILVSIHISVCNETMHCVTW